MKKLCGGAIALFIATLMSYAQTGEVYSLNIVGFQKLTAVSQGLTLVSTPFERSPNTIDDVIGPQLTGGKSDLAADLTALWNPSSQSYETYWLKASDSNWYDRLGNRATNVHITPSQGLWLQSRRTSNQIVIVSGDVVGDAAVTNALVPGLNLVSYPFSSEIELNSSALTNGKGGKSELAADMIALWDSGSQMYRQYWLRSSDRKWYDLNNVLATNVYIGGGRGFWYQNRNTNAFVWVELKPYTF